MFTSYDTKILEKHLSPMQSSLRATKYHNMATTYPGAVNEGDAGSCDERLRKMRFYSDTK